MRPGWNEWEWTILRRDFPRLGSAIPELAHRSRAAIKCQASIAGIKFRTEWTSPDLKSLRRMWESWATRADIMAAFPNRTWSALVTQAKLMGARRPTAAIARKAAGVRGELLYRARKAGMTARELDIASRSGSYFRTSSNVRPSALIAAAELLGARLAIEWDDGEQASLLTGPEFCDSVRTAPRRSHDRE